MQALLASFTPGPQAAEANALLTTAQAARLLGVSTSTLHQWRFYKNPKGPRFVRLGMRSIRYDRRTLIAWIKAQETAR